MSSEIKYLAFEVARAQLSSQKEDLRHSRSQAGMAATIAGLVATVFASMVDFENVVKEGEYFFLGIPMDMWLAVGLFAASVYCAAMVGVTGRVCTFELNPVWLLQQEDAGMSIDDVRVQLAKDCDRYFDQNEVAISEARNYLWWSVVAGFTQILAWLMVLVP